MDDSLKAEHYITFPGTRVSVSARQLGLWEAGLTGSGRRPFRQCSVTFLTLACGVCIFWGTMEMARVQAHTQVLRPQVQYSLETF
jgi:hypothetical protein